MFGFNVVAFFLPTKPFVMLGEPRWLGFLPELLTRDVFINELGDRVSEEAPVVVDRSVFRHTVEEFFRELTIKL